VPPKLGAVCRSSVTPFGNSQINMFPFTGAYQINFMRRGSMLKNRYVLFMLLLITIFTLSCDLSMGEGQLLVVINTEDINLPESNEIAYFKIVGESGTGETFSRTTTDNSILVENIVPGDWEINVSGYNTSEYTIASALLNTTVYKDHTTTETLYLGNPFALTIEGIPDIVQENDLLTLVAKGAFGTDPLFSWYVNGVEQTESSSTLNYLFSTSGNFTISLSVRYAGDQSHCKQTIIVSEPYTITYHLDGGIAPVSNPSTYKKSSETIALEPPTKNNYRFAGWYLDPEFTNPASETIISGSTGDKQYYAAWMVENLLIPDVAWSTTEYGISTAIGEDSAIVGTGDYANRAYIYERDLNGNWGEGLRINSPRDDADGFGFSGAIDHNFAIIGAIGGYNPTGVVTGCAYVFERNSSGDGWSLVTELYPIEDSSNYGFSIAIDNDLAVVSSVGSDYYEKSGFVYIYKRNDIGIWEIVSKCYPPDGEYETHFGYSVDIKNDTMLIGDPKGSCVYIYRTDSIGNWFLDKILTSSLNNYGYDVAIDNSYFIIGTSRASKVEIYARNELNSWEYNSTLSGPNGFGESVDMFNDVIVIGAPSSETVYIYKVDEYGIWNKSDEIKALDGKSGDSFGAAVAIYKEDLFVGAPEKNAAYWFELE